MSGIQAFSPINGETVWLISNKLREYLAKHTLGYGLEIAGEPPVQLHKPVTLSWEPVLYTVAYGTDPKLQDAIRVTTDATSVQITTLPTGKTCYWQVTAHTGNDNTVSDVFHFHTANSLRILVMEGADNARNLGGYLTADKNHRIVQGKIFRGNRLDTLTPEGLRTALDIYKIRTDLDLRNEKDGCFYNGVRSPLGDSVNYVNIIRVQYDTAMRVTDSFLSELLVFTKPENYPVYIHCSAGRDRSFLQKHRSYRRTAANNSQHHAGRNII